ncbi:MAG TPA: four helix bundle protein [Candidatus Atribacteria bacterium]|nr:four helix bundle protein [Candidatus Atribacteria bacterium]
MKTNSFKDLIVWQKAYKLVLEIYKITCNFPKSELYALTSQMRRAAISIPSNISEGYGSGYKKEYTRFLSIAYASLSELETQYLLAIDLNYTNSNEIIEELFKETGKMLYRMIHPIR